MAGGWWKLTLISRLQGLVTLGEFWAIRVGQNGRFVKVVVARVNGNGLSTVWTTPVRLRKRLLLKPGFFATIATAGM